MAIITTYPLNPNANITVDLTVELLQETHIALLDREHQLREQALYHDNQSVREIAQRQLARVVGALAGIEDAIECAAAKLAA